MSEEKKGSSANELSRERTELAEKRTDMAQDRTDLAGNRTFQAAERTYAAWVRTGFTIASVGWTVGRTFLDTAESTNALFIGGVLTIIGILCFVYGWFGYRRIYAYLHDNYPKSETGRYPFATNMAVVSILTGLLLFVFIFAFAILLF